MAPQINGILGATANVIVDSNRIANDAFLGGLNGSGITESTIIEGNHMVAKTTQNLVKFNSVVGKARVGIAVKVENDFGAGLLQSALEELGLIGGVYVAEFVQTQVFNGSQVMRRNWFISKLFVCSLEEHLTDQIT